MKKLLFTLSLIMCSTFIFAQLTEGKYKILSVKGFRDGKTIYENFFKDSTAIVRVMPQIVNIVIAGYSAHTYLIEKPTIVKEHHIYPAKEIQTGIDIRLLSSRLEEYPELDCGILIVQHSESYSDVFAISKLEK